MIFSYLNTTESPWLWIWFVEAWFYWYIPSGRYLKHNKRLRICNGYGIRNITLVCRTETSERKFTRASDDYKINTANTWRMFNKASISNTNNTECMLSYFSDCWKTTVNVYSNNIQNCFIAVLSHLLWCLFTAIFKVQLHYTY